MAVICGNQSQTSDGEKCSHGQVNIFSEAFEFRSRKIHWTRHSKSHDDTKLTQALLIISPINITNWGNDSFQIPREFQISSIALCTHPMISWVSTHFRHYLPRKIGFFAVENTKWRSSVEIVGVCIFRVFLFSTLSSQNNEDSENEAKIIDLETSLMTK